MGQPHHLTSLLIRLNHSTKWIYVNRNGIQRGNKSDWNHCHQARNEPIPQTPQKVHRIKHVCISDLIRNLTQPSTNPFFIRKVFHPLPSPLGLNPYTHHPVSYPFSCIKCFNICLSLSLSTLTWPRNFITVNLMHHEGVNETMEVKSLNTQQFNSFRQIYTNRVSVIKIIIIITLLLLLFPSSIRKTTQRLRNTIIKMLRLIAKKKKLN